MGVGSDAVQGKPNYQYISSLITISHAQFTEIYDRLAESHDSDPLLVVNALFHPPADHNQRYHYALEAAHNAGWLNKLVRLLARTDAFREEAISPKSSSAIQLEAMINPQAGFLDAGLHMPSLVRAMHRVCMIRIAPDDTIGTGFLIGPQVVLTAWHVIKNLVEDANPTRAKADTAERLEIVFDYTENNPGTVVRAHENWLLGASPAHELELKQAVTFDPDVTIDGFESNLDFAMIFLARPVGIERGFYPLDRNRFAELPCQLTLYQHPGSTKLKFASGTATEYWPKSIRARLLHGANTTQGSSGGLVLDASGEVVALHQSGGWNKMRNSIVNGAVPTSLIAERGVNVSVTDGLEPICLLPNSNHPVFGREHFQELVIMAITGSSRIIAVQGEQQAGRSFSVEILRAHLSAGEHAVVHVSARDFPQEAKSAAIFLLHKCGASSESFAALPSAEESHTSNAAWLKDELFPVFLELLVTTAIPRIMWIIIDDLDEPLPETTSTQLLALLLHSVHQVSNLRIILLGRALLPGLPVETRFDQLSLVTKIDVENTIKRHLVSSQHKAKLDPKTVAEILCPHHPRTPPLRTLAKDYTDRVCSIIARGGH
ncbi:hypothetical protein GTP41_20770 [Pseudoduganella sp. DS3]|uniref:Serine protease n=1 Tax=Pseudoduganella guangdongensis TaxID=2692179 RepID=A0A6N9HMC4_9BURK|nr:serine protease [Pseudoduganella guangdongensis]MYN04529.1 hypothetical protein [Pseudoduganella guangdongensis]